MKIAILMMCGAMTACAVEPSLGAKIQAVTTTTVCDPISGECIDEVDGNPNGGGDGAGGTSYFSCTYSASMTGCGTYVGFGYGGTNVYAALDVMEMALSDWHFQPGVGYHVTCSYSASTGRANCNLHQGPWIWYCEARHDYDVNDYCEGLQ